ncbi:hypothetical protein GS429_13115 [Natronorubrum sp. JWXQ-INN-674]|uniref:DUF4430 domain-containing protein n=1 Tax=Natronorubrum halalkaliphilum TaxID=2691917 RepID=A0A6B0VMD4_9EURY|nr:hypothetical protein [Natronorubrum halalkaliphilum]MXV62991.1 hypothetical protein [Natronorubrum halalkaliphilum]
MNRRTVLLACSSLLPLAGCSMIFDERLDARGTIAIVVDGEPVDLTADRYQSEHAANESIDFHFHEGDEYWYMEGEEPVTFAEGIDLLPHFGYDQRGTDHVVTIDGTSYDGSDPDTELTFFVDSETVDPTSYELSDGEDLRLEITTGE